MRNWTIHYTAKSGGNQTRTKAVQRKVKPTRSDQRRIAIKDLIKNVSRPNHRVYNRLRVTSVTVA